MKEKGHNFIIKVSSTVKLCAVTGSHMPDGSYLTVIRGKIEDPAGSANGRKKWNRVETVVGRSRYAAEKNELTRRMRTGY